MTLIVAPTVTFIAITILVTLVGCFKSNNSGLQGLGFRVSGLGPARCQIARCQRGGALVEKVLPPCQNLTPKLCKPKWEFPKIGDTNIVP